MLQSDSSGDEPINSGNFRDLLPCLGNTEISSDSTQWETSAPCNSIRCETQSLAHFADLSSWAEMFAARHKASNDIKTAFSTWHSTTVVLHALFRNCTAGVCSLPLCPSHLCLWRPSHQAAPRSRGCWARACPAWRPCARMTCSSPGQCLSEQTSASSSSERTSCCCSEPPYEASLAQKHKHVVMCISCSPGQEVITLSF